MSHKLDRQLVCGVSTCGKSTLVFQKIEEFKKENDGPIFDFDHEGTHADRLGVEPVFLMHDIPLAMEHSQIICYDPSIEFPLDFRTAYDVFCQWVFAYAEETPEEIKLFVTDELQELEGARDQCPGLTRILARGRKFGIYTLLAGSQLNRLNDITRNQVTEVFVFAHRSRNASKPLADYNLSFEEVQELKVSKTLSEYFHVHLGSGKIDRCDLRLKPVATMAR